MTGNKQLASRPTAAQVPAREGLSVTRWAVTVVGGIAAFVGLFIMFADDDHFVGIGGNASWRVGDIAPAWGWGLFIAGALFLLAAGVIFLRYRPAGRLVARAPASARTDLITHAAVFVLVNAFVWIQDIAVGDGVNYAWWITAPWAAGLAAQAIASRTPTRS